MLNWRHHCRNCGILVCQSHSRSSCLLINWLVRDGVSCSKLASKRCCDGCKADLSEAYEEEGFVEAMKRHGAVFRIKGCREEEGTFGRDMFYKKSGVRNGRPFYSPVTGPDASNSVFYCNREWWHGTHAGAATPHVRLNGHAKAERDEVPPTDGWSHRGVVKWL